MKTPLLLIVAILCVGCEEQLRKKHSEEIATLKATHDQEIAACEAREKANIDATIANFRPPGPDMRESHRRLAASMEFGSALLFAILLLRTIGALMHQMAQIDQRHGVHIGWMMVLVGVVMTVAASIIVPDWAGYPYRPVLWLTTMARPDNWSGNLLAILIAALVSFGIAYWLMKLGEREIPRKRKWRCGLVIMGLVFVGSHYKLACWSIIFSIGSPARYLIYPISVGELIGGLFGIAAYWIGNPESETRPAEAVPAEKEEEAPIEHLFQEDPPATGTEKNNETPSRYLHTILEWIIRILGMRH